MSDVKELGTIPMLGLDPETYKELLEIAKREGKGVVDVTSEALRNHINKNKPLKENKKLLCEG